MAHNFGYTNEKANLDSFIVLNLPISYANPPLS